MWQIYNLCDICYVTREPVVSENSRLGWTLDLDLIFEGDVSMNYHVYGCNSDQ